MKYEQENKLIDSYCKVLSIIPKIYEPTYTTIIKQIILSLFIQVSTRTGPLIHFFKPKLIPKVYMKKIRIINDKLFELQLKATMRHLRNAHSQSQSGSALLLLTSVQNLYVVNFKVKCKAVLKFKVKTACIMTFCCWYVVLL